jgi:hypothetical protein
VGVNKITTEGLSNEVLMVDIPLLYPDGIFWPVRVCGSCQANGKSHQTQSLIFES